MRHPCAAFLSIREHTADRPAVGSDVKCFPDPLQAAGFEAPGTY